MSIEMYAEFYGRFLTKVRSWSELVVGAVGPASTTFPGPGANPTFHVIANIERQA